VFDLIPEIHPGEVLQEDFINELPITQHSLAVAIGVPPRRINEIVQGKRGITADTACRLSAFFGNSAEFWMNLQTQYELRKGKRLLKEQLANIEPLKYAA
jgi:addiction module HigA family antidote